MTKFCTGTNINNFLGDRRLNDFIDCIAAKKNNNGNDRYRKTGLCTGLYSVFYHKALVHN